MIHSGNFTFYETTIPGLKTIETKLHVDPRGYFMESYHQKAFQAGGIEAVFVQDNQSMSMKGVLRGLHFQKKNPQGKLVRVIKGEAYDVAVDLRKNSSTYGKWEGFYLSDQESRMIYIPEGFAHGFLVLSEKVEFAYKCTHFYEPQHEDGIIFNDPDLNIAWPLARIQVMLLSENDKKLKSFKAFNQEN